MQKPLVSVLLPVYNCENYILEAVESILQQTYSHFELLIIDDCSTDATVEKIKTLTDQRIQLIEKPKNSGITNSLNFGLTIAKGKYIARMDGDDISLPLRFEKQVAFLEANENVIVCATNYQILDTDILVKNPEENEFIKIDLLSDSCIAHPTVMLRKSILYTNNIFYQNEFEPAEDYDLWVRLLDYGLLHNLQENLLFYRNHNNQVSFTKKEIQSQKANLSRVNMLKKLKVEIIVTERIAYEKMFNFKSKLNFNELKAFFNLKVKVIKANNQQLYFNKEAFEKFFYEKEKLAVSQYFLGRKNFSPLILFHYLITKKHISVKLENKQIFLMFTKCLLFYSK